MIFYIILAGILLIFAYFFTVFVFDLLLRGFAPFIPSRPWVVEQLMAEIDLKKENPTFLAFSSGRSGFFYALSKRYPHSIMVGIEPSFFPYLVAKVQGYLRFRRLVIYRQKIHRVDVSQADFIYSHLYPKKLRGLGKKLKFECQPGTIIVSTGFNIPYLEPFKIVDLPDRKGRLDWLSKNQELFQSKRKRFKKEKKAYFYEI